jgi:choline/glycine/proline betaine transport protein
LRSAIKKILATMEPVVFIGSALVIVVFVVLGSVYADEAEAVFAAWQSGIVSRFGWLYMLTATALLVLALTLAVTSLGNIRLGGDDSRPEFSYLGWFTMLFSAGMGTGLMFWGVAEPMNHYMEPPVGEGGSPGALREAMRISFFHWGLHPWAIYAIFGLSIAYYHFRHGLPLAPRSLLYPLIGERIRGGGGHLVDILATVGTLFGVATSLGFGAIQINAGIGTMADVPDATGVQVGIIAVITCVATISVVIGLHRGIQRLSFATMGLAALLLVFVFAAGPTAYIIEIFLTSLGAYLQKLIYASFWLDLRRDSTWQADWTLFYWSWWISWSPFVGVFVARISRGRTVREFVLSVMLVPSLATFAWLSVFGGTGLHLQGTQGGLADVILADAAIALHTLLNALPFSEVTGVLATVLVIIFFVTSSDSGSLVDDMVTSGGHPDPPRAQRVFWALSEGAVAATLLLAGGLQALRSVALSSGLLMAVLLLVASYGILKAMRIDRRVDGEPKTRRLAE